MVLLELQHNESTLLAVLRRSDPAFSERGRVTIRPWLGERRGNVIAQLYNCVMRYMKNGIHQGLDNRLSRVRW